MRPGRRNAAVVVAPFDTHVGGEAADMLLRMLVTGVDARWGHTSPYW